MALLLQVIFLDFLHTNIIQIVLRIIRSNDNTALKYLKFNFIVIINIILFFDRLFSSYTDRNIQQE